LQAEVIILLMYSFFSFLIVIVITVQMWNVLSFLPTATNVDLRELAGYFAG